MLASLSQLPVSMDVNTVINSNCLVYHSQRGLHFSPWGIRFSPRGLRFSPWGLRFSQRGLCFSPWGLRFSSWGLRS